MGTKGTGGSVKPSRSPPEDFSHVTIICGGMDELAPSQVSQCRAYSAFAQFEYVREFYDRYFLFSRQYSEDSEAVWRERV